MFCKKYKEKIKELENINEGLRQEIVFLRSEIQVKELKIYQTKEFCKMEIKKLKKEIKKLKNKK